MALKHAVLALVAERRGYGYDLVQRFEERIGWGWRLNPSAVYPALDELERAGLIAGTPRQGGTRRSPRVVYTTTSRSAAAIDAWMQTNGPPLEPVRSDLHLKLAFAQAPHHGALLAQLAGRERATEELLGRYAAAAPRTATPGLVDAAVVARLSADLGWLRAARAASER